MKNLKSSREKFAITDKWYMQFISGIPFICWFYNHQLDRGIEALRIEQRLSKQQMNRILLHTETLVENI